MPAEFALVADADKAWAILFVRIGHLVFFDVEMVRAYVAETHL